MKPTLKNTGEEVVFVDYLKTNPVVFKCLQRTLNCEECRPQLGVCEFKIRVAGREEIAKLCEIKFN